LWQADYDHAGFNWIDCNDRDNSVLSFLRQTSDGKNQTVVILNLTPVPRPSYRLGVPRGGKWKEVLNSDAGLYAGSNTGNCGGVAAQDVPSHGHQHSAEFFLPPLSVVVFQAE
jgi:1,4-alpha-glucan branching enzyme